jgi:hypothetical protein
MIKMELRAFHGSEAIKAKYIARVQKHQEMDEIIQGQYWEHGKGCAVGCTIHHYEHSQYEVELGIPRQLAYLQDRLFEGMTNEDAKLFPLAFLQAIPVGADVSLIVAKFLVWMLGDVSKFARPDGKVAIEQVINLYTRKIAGETITEREWMNARRAAADAVADAAAYAASADADADADAADAAAYADAAAAYADAAADAADAAVAAAAAAADAADAAAYADAAAADAAYAAAADAAADDAAAAVAYAAYAAAADADAAARKKHFKIMADMLLTLLGEEQDHSTNSAKYCHRSSDHRLSGLLLSYH